MRKNMWYKNGKGPAWMGGYELSNACSRQYRRLFTLSRAPTRGDAKFRTLYFKSPAEAVKKGWKKEDQMRKNMWYKNGKGPAWMGGYEFRPYLVRGRTVRKFTLSRVPTRGDAKFRTLYFKSPAEAIKKGWKKEIK